MSYLYLVLGVLIFFISWTDLLITILSPTGAGIITNKTNYYGAKLYSWLVGRKGTNKLLEYKVIFLFVLITIVWIVLTWASFSLIYISEAGSILHSSTLETATYAEKVYFTGYTLTTLGPGEYEPNGNIWKFFTNFVSFFGFTIITVCITYVIPLVTNLTQSKALSLKIAGIGESTNDILVNSFDGEDFSEFTSQFSTIALEILKYATNHLAYPILHYVHQSSRAENIVLKIVSLDETLNILCYNIPEQYNKHPLGLKELRRAITIYLDTLKHLEPASEGDAPPLPDFEAIEHSLPITLKNTESARLKTIYNQLGRRRKLHKTNLEKYGWKWEDIDTHIHSDLNLLKLD